MAYYVAASWWSGNALVPRVEDLRFKSRVGQIGHGVANWSPPLRHFMFRGCVARAQCCGDGSANSLLFLANSESIMKNLIFILFIGLKSAMDR